MALVARHDEGQKGYLREVEFDEAAKELSKELAAEALCLWTHAHRYPLAAAGGVLGVAVAKKMARGFPLLGPLVGLAFSLLPTIVIGPPVGVAALYAAEGKDLRPLANKAKRAIRAASLILKEDNENEQIDEPNDLYAARRSDDEPRVEEPDDD